MARRSEFYVRAAVRTISRSFASLTREILFLPREHKIHILLLYKHTDDGVFDDFPKISDYFPNISEDFPKLLRRPDENVPGHFPRISENFRRLPRKTQIRFDDTPTNLSTI